MKATPGFCLPAKYIFHAVGPKKDEDISLLASFYRKALDLAGSMNLRSIAFPCISTGIYGVDSGQAAYTALKSVCDWLHTGDNLAFFKKADDRLYIDRWSQYVEAPPPVRIRRIVTEPLPAGYQHYTGQGVTCGRPSCTSSVPTPESVPIVPRPALYAVCEQPGAYTTLTNCASNATRRCPGCSCPNAYTIYGGYPYQSASSGPC